MTYKDYEQTPGISASMVKMFYLNSPAHFKFWFDNQGESEALRQGRLIHGYFLQPEKLSELVHIADDYTDKPEPEKDYKTKVNREWKQTNKEYADIHGKDFALKSEMEWVWEMREKLKERGYYELINAGQKETPFYKEIDGITFKCLVDIYTPEIIHDYKSTTCAKPGKFDYDVMKYGYHIQAAINLDVTGAKEFKLIAQEKNPPYEPFLFKIPDELIEYGRQIYKEYGRRLQQCFDDDNWPGYEADYIGGEHVVNVPKWLELELENQES